VTAKAKKTGFEASLAELEALVARMESGDMPLDETLKGFERGVQLTRECQAALLAAQARVQQLVERPEGATPVDFNAPADE
jgi:exodeoxyribonuclease VII small subunit